MDALLIYMAKVAVYLTGYYLVYIVFLSRDTAYGRNRAFILLSLLAAFILPFISIQTYIPINIRFFGKFLTEVFVTASAQTVKPVREGPVSFITLNSFYSIYLVVSSIFTIKLIIDFANLFFLIFKSKEKGSRIVLFHGLKTSGFSAMGYIFINTRLNPEDIAEIIKHEQNHLKQNHFIDIIFIELIKAFQWFNPVVYLFDRSLRAIHEYQADHDCISSGVSIIKYQNLLINQVFKTGAFNLTNSFSNPSLIKKRMIMMTKKRTSYFAGFKILFVVPVIALIFTSISSIRKLSDSSFGPTASGRIHHYYPVKLKYDQVPPPPLPPTKLASDLSSDIPREESPASDDEIPFTVAEEMPMFPGGDAALLRFIAENTKYPQKAKEQNIQGKVIIKFCVTASGSVNRISIIKGVSHEIDEEASRVVQTIPGFIPGKQGGKAVPVWFIVPITFSLK